MSNANIIHLANEFTLKYEILNYPLKIDPLYELVKRLGFFIYTYSEAAEFISKYNLKEYMKYPAFTFVKREKSGNVIKVILYRNDLPYGEKIFCILHEIGHIYLSHTYYGILGKSPDDSVANRQEEEADIFAYHVAAPLCLLKAMDVSSVEGIVSKTLLETKRAEHVFVLLTEYKENDEIEQQIVHNFALNYLKSSTQTYHPAVKEEESLDEMTQSMSPGINAIAAPVISVPRWQLFLKKHATVLAISIILILAGAYAIFQAVNKSGQGTVSTLVPSSSGSSTTVPASDEKVYISQNGEKYHLPGCQYINGNMVEVTLEEAIEQGYEPCKRCIE